MPIAKVKLNVSPQQTHNRLGLLVMGYIQVISYTAVQTQNAVHFVHKMNNKLNHWTTI